MAKKSEKSDAQGPMFRDSINLNGVNLAHNAHASSDYLSTSRLAIPSVPLEDQVREHVYGGSPHGGSGMKMSFASHTEDPMKPAPESIDPRNPAGWPLTTDRFQSLEKKSKR